MSFIAPVLPPSRRPFNAARPTFNDGGGRSGPGIVPPKLPSSPIDNTALFSGSPGIGTTVGTTNGAAKPGPKNYLAGLDPTTVEAIEAAIAAIEAQYQLQRSELEGGQSVLGAERADYDQQLSLARSRALEGVDVDANARGVYSSGQRLRRRAETSAEYARQGSLTEVQYGNALASIQRALDALSANEKIAALAQVENILEAQGNSDIQLGVNGLLAEGDEFVGTITLEDIRNYLAETV